MIIIIIRISDSNFHAPVQIFGLKLTTGVKIQERNC